MNGQDYTQLTLFQEDSLASRFPWPESKKGRKMTGFCGPKCCELSENYIRIISSVKTYLEYCTLPQMTFVRTWSRRATKSGYLIMKLRLSEQNIDGSGSSLWRTPEAGDSANRTFAVNSRMEPKLSAQVKLWPTPDSSPRGTRATDLVVNGKTARRRNSGQRRGIDLQTAVKMWPTPREFMYKDSATDKGKSNLGEVVGGQLNPDWVDWLMGFPINYTEVE